MLPRRPRSRWALALLALLLIAAAATVWLHENPPPGAAPERIAAAPLADPPPSAPAPLASDALTSRDELTGPDAPKPGSALEADVLGGLRGGFVLDEQGSPIQGATVYWSGRRTTTDAAGRFTFPYQPGGHRDPMLFVSHPEYETVLRGLEPHVRSVLVRLPVGGRMRTSVFTEDERPIPGARLSWAIEPGSWIDQLLPAELREELLDLESETDQNGVGSLAGALLEEYDGTYEVAGVGLYLQVKKDEFATLVTPVSNWAIGWSRSDEPAADSDRHHLTLHPAARKTIRVVDRYGAGVEGAGVLFGSPGLRREARTDSLGLASIQGAAEESKWNLRVDHPDHGTWSCGGSIQLPSDPPLEVVLRGKPELAGQVECADPEDLQFLRVLPAVIRPGALRPRAGAILPWEEARPAEYFGDARWLAGADLEPVFPIGPEGRFTVEAPVDGPGLGVAVLARPGNYLLGLVPAAELGRPIQVANLVLLSGRLRLRGTPEMRNVVLRLKRGAHHHSALLEPDGSFRTVLPAGRWRLHIDGLGFAQSMKIELRDPHTELDLDLTKLRQLEAHLRDGDEPIPHKKMEAKWSTPTGKGWAVSITDAAGIARFPAVGDGPVALCMWPSYRAFLPQDDLVLVPPETDRVDVPWTTSRLQVVLRPAQDRRLDGTLVVKHGHAVEIPVVAGQIRPIELPTGYYEINVRCPGNWKRQRVRVGPGETTLIEIHERAPDG